jgi:tRNA(Ile)-lysidine synthetase-like protein
MTHDPSFMVRKSILSSANRLQGGALALLGVSGGADSLAMAAAVSSCGAPDVRFGAVVVDHGLQPGSDRLAAHAAGQCRDLGLDPVIEAHVHVPTGPGSGGLEQAARLVRRRALLDAAQTHDASSIWLAHTADDQAETVLLGLLRGSGPRSMAGMRAHDGIWERPLLGLRRDIVRASLAEYGIAAHEDPQNEDVRFTRARIRHVVLPLLERELGGHITEQLVRSAELFRDDTDALDAMAAAVIASAGLAADFSSISALSPAEAKVGTELEIDALAALPRALRTRVIRLALLAQGCISPEKDHIDAVEHLAMEPRARGPVRVPGNLQVTKDRITRTLTISSRK